MQEISPFLGEKIEAIRVSNLYSIEAEKAVLGCLLAESTQVFDEVNVTLCASDFFVPAHQEIFKAFNAMYEDLIPIDVMTIHQWLTDRKMAEAVGSPGILAELLVGFATHLNVGSYIRIVKDKSLLRCLQSACSTIVQDIVDMPDSVPAVLDRAESAIFRITQGQQTVEIWDAKRCVNEYKDERAKIQRGDYQNRLQTGIMALDRENGGFPNPGYIIIAAGTSQGKSVLAINLLENWCRCGLKVGVFSLEMTRKQIIGRAVASTAAIDGRLLNGKLHDAQALRVDTALTGIAGWQFEIDQTSRLGLSDLRSRSRQMAKRGANAIEIDYLQLMRALKGGIDRRDQLAEISGEIKVLSNELNIPFIVLSQVNREGRKSGDLQLLHLAECSALEQDADQVILLEKKSGSDGFPLSAIPYIAHIAKYRNGATGDVELTLNAPQQRFS